jgi:hypothetical protein
MITDDTLDGELERMLHEGKWLCSPWVGVDFDGTLARHNPQDFPQAGEPIEPMVEFVKGLLEQDVRVKVFTARAGDPTIAGQNLLPVIEFCRAHFGEALPITATKDYLCVAILDDIAIGVNRDEGILDSERSNADISSQLLGAWRPRYLPTT